MSAIQHAWSHPLSEVVGWSLVHFVWQGAAIAIIVGVVLRVMRRSSANARYVAACFALATMAACPVVTAGWLARHVDWSTANSPPMPVVTGEFLDAAPSSDGLEYAPPIERSPREWLGSSRVTNAADRAGGEAATPLQGVPPRPTLRERVGSTVERWLPWIVGVWLVGVGLLSGRLLFGWIQVQRLRRSAIQPVADACQELLRQLAGRLRITRPVRLVESALVQVPTVVGWLRPMILLPASAITGLTTDQLQAVLAHELAHIRRHDYLVNLLQTVVETLLFYHPAVWWVSHRIRLEREHCCDDIAVATCGDRVGYARMLLALEELRAPASRLAVAADGGSLRSRIARLLSLPVPSEKRSSALAASLIALTAVVSLATSIYVSLRADDANLNASESLVVRGSPDPAHDATAGLLKQTETESDDRDESGNLRSEPRRGQETRAEQEAQAFGGNKKPMAERIVNAKAAARREYLRILMVLGDPTTKPTQALYDALNKSVIGEPPESLSRTLADFLRMWVVAGNSRQVADIAKAGSLDLGSLTMPALVVLDEDGALRGKLSVQVSADGRVDEVALRKFLVEHALPPRDAEQLLAQAIAKVRRDKKLVLLQETAAWCFPCHQLSKFLEEQRDLIDAHYVRVKIDRYRFTGGEATMNRIRTGKDRGIPWLAVLDTDGRPIATSGDSDQENFGYPSKRDEIRRFLMLLKSTAPRLTDEQLETLQKAFVAEQKMRTEEILREEQRRMDGLTVRMVLMTEKPTLGQPIKVRIEMTNLFGEPQTYDPSEAGVNGSVYILGQDSGAWGVPYNGRHHQTKPSPRVIQPNETVVLAEEIDVHQQYLIWKPGRYQLRWTGERHAEFGNSDPKPSDISRWPPPLNTAGVANVRQHEPLDIDIEDGPVEPIRPCFAWLREHANYLFYYPDFKPGKWQASMSDGVITLEHIPQGETTVDATLQLWFTERKLTPDQVRQRQQNGKVLHHLGRSRIGHGYLLVEPTHAERMWSKHIPRIQRAILNTTSPAPISPELQDENDPIQVTTLRDRLRHPTFVEWVGIPLRDGIFSLSEQLATDITLDLDSLKQAGVDEEAELTASFRDVPLEQAIKRLLSPLGVEARCEIRENHIVIVVDSRPAVPKKQETTAAPTATKEAGGTAPTDSVQRAIERGIEYLKRQQQADGSWSETGPMRGGVTALALHALLQAGVKVDDPVVQRGLKLLRSIDAQHTYVVALQTLVFCAANPKTDADLIRRNVEWLERAQLPAGQGKGGWGYQQGHLGADGSNTCFAVLALHAAANAGCTVRDETWLRIGAYWLDGQRADGAWGYQVHPASQASASMTCAGIASLSIVERHRPRGVGESDSHRKAIQNALNWLASDFAAAWPSHWLLYYCHCLSKVGSLENPQRLGDHDWRAAMVQRLLKEQGDDGSFTTADSAGFGPNTVKTVATSFALLALTGQAEPAVPPVKTSPR